MGKCECPGKNGKGREIRTAPELEGDEGGKTRSLLHRGGPHVKRKKDSVLGGGGEEKEQNKGGKGVDGRRRRPWSGGLEVRGKPTQKSKKWGGGTQTTLMGKLPTHKTKGEKNKPRRKKTNEKPWGGVTKPRHTEQKKKMQGGVPGRHIERREPRKGKSGKKQKRGGRRQTKSATAVLC